MFEEGSGGACGIPGVDGMGAEATETGGGAAGLRAAKSL